MSHIRTATKFPTRHTQDRRVVATAGPNGIALAPPAYGLDVVDRVSAGAGPLQCIPGPEMQLGSGTLGPGGLSPAPGRTLVQPQALATRPNRTGLPQHLKAGIESLSGYDMDDVRVHYRSSQPAQMQALAYTQGTDIYVAPGQEKHLPHEAWHVVQQKQGRVQPTWQVHSVAINDDIGLEHEAEVMGSQALQMRTPEKSASAFPIYPVHDFAFFSVVSPGQCSAEVCARSSRFEEATRVRYGRSARSRMTPTFREARPEAMGERQMQPLADGSRVLEQSSTYPHRLNETVGQNPIQLFPDFESWKKNQAITEGMQATQQYLQFALENLIKLVKSLTGYTITQKTLPENLAAGGPRETYDALMTLVKKVRQGGDLQASEYASLAQRLTCMEEWVRLVGAESLEGEEAMQRFTRLRKSEQALEQSVSPLGLDLLKLVLSFAPISTLATFRGTNYYLKTLLDSELIFKLDFLETKHTVHVRFMDVSNYMQGYQFFGLHGSSMQDQASLYRGLQPRPQESDRVFKTSQLGEGFYLTEGSKFLERKFASSVADKRAAMTNTESVVFRVFIKPEKLVRKEVDEDDWADMKADRIPEKLKKLTEEPLALTAPIVDNEPARQIKINPSLFSLVRVLPPHGFTNPQFFTWIEEVVSQHPWDFGEVKYHY